jgi:predicted dehydrogenase
MRFLGERGSAIFHESSLQVYLNDGTTQVTTGDSDAAVRGSGADPMAFSHLMHQALLEDFVMAIREKRDPRVTGRQALETQSFIDALIRSAQAGAPVSMR